MNDRYYFWGPLLYHSTVLNCDEILKDFKDSLEHSIGYIEMVLEGDLTDCDEIGYLFRDFVGEKALFSHGRYPTNQKIYEALENMNRRYEEGQDVL